MFLRLAINDHMIPDFQKFLGGKDRTLGEEQENIMKQQKFIVTDVIEKKNGYVNPVIVNFQNGDLKDSSDFNVTLTPNAKGETNVKVETPSGHVFKDADRNELPQPKQVILIRNRKTNKVKLVEVDSTVLLNSALLSASKTSEEVTDFKKDFRTLQKTFGGKKIVSRLEQREKLNLTSLPIADEVKRTVEDIKVEGNVSINDTEIESLVNLLPPVHRDALKVSEVYVMNEILSEEELEALKNQISTIEENKFNPNEFSGFFMDCYTEAKKSKDDLDTRLAGVLFAETLIKFLKMPSKRIGGKKAVLCEFSTVIHEKLINEFCIKTETSVSRPLTMRDKGLCYIIAVCLISCNYKVNLKLLSTVTSVHLMKLIRLARAVGAVPIPKQEHVVALKLPLPALPKATGGKARRK